MSDKIVSINHFKVLKKQAEDEDDRAWKDSVLKTLDEIKARIESGETSGLLVAELCDEVGQWRTHMLGLGEYDHFTLAGIMELTKMQLIDMVFDE